MKELTTEQLRRLEGHEGLVIQGWADSCPRSRNGKSRTANSSGSM